MSALPAPFPAALPTSSSPVLQEPVALLQLDATRAREAASAVYREVRRGRRVVAVASGGAEAAAALAQALDAIGVATVHPAPGEALLHEGVALVAGPETPPVRGAPVAGRPLRVALAGCGVVGGGVLARLLDDPRFVVVGVLVRDPAKPRDMALASELAITDPAALLAREPDVLVEAVSDPSTGLALIRAALARGIEVVSASKQAIAGELPALRALAAAHGVGLRYSASVGGGSPLIETVRRARAHAPVTRIEAVLNGTCNFILNRLAAGVPFAEALQAARAAGFAEEDPTADLTGLDAAAKLSILAHEASGAATPVDRVVRETLSGDTRSGSRQIACIDLLSGEAEIRFRPVADDALFIDLQDEWNAVRVTTDDGRVFTARGRGAGRTPTTESVWADLSELLS